MENVLSFGEGENERLDIELKDLNYFLGPNNAGKSNVMRGIQHFMLSLNNQVSYDDHLEIMRDRNEHRPFNIELHIDLEKEMDDIIFFFEMFKEFIKERKKIEINSFNDERIRDLGLDEKLYANLNNTEIKEKLVLFYSEIIDVSLEHIIKKIIPNNILTISLQYDGTPKSNPEKRIFTDENNVVIINSLLTKNDRESISGYQMENVFDIRDDFQSIFKEYAINNKIDIDENFIFKHLDEQVNRSIHLSMQLGNIDHLRKEYISSKLNEVFPYIQPQGYYQFDKMIYGLISRKTTIADILRNFKGVNSLNDYLFYKENGQINTGYLPSVLYDLKNSKDINRQIIYENIQKQFEIKTQLFINVISDINYSKYEEIDEGKAISSHLTAPYHLYDKSMKYTIEKGFIEGADGVIELRTKIKNGKDFAFEKCGTGLFEVLYFITLMNISQENDVILLDEPAQNLHPRWQTDFLKGMKNMDNAGNRQFFITTHSPYLLPAELSDENNYYYIKKNNSVSNISKISLPDKDIKHCFQKKKEVFFSDLNILVEGPSDVIYLSPIFNKIFEYSFSDIEIVQCRGGGDVIKAHNQLLQWGIPSIGIIDADVDHEESENIIKLPCDVEGTIVLGDFLWQLKDIINEEYNLKKDFQKLFPTENNRKKIDKSLDDIFKQFKEFYESSKSSDDLMDNLDIIMDIQAGLKSQIEKKKDSLFKAYKISRNKLDKFINLKKQVHGKTDLANLIVQENKDLVMGSIHSSLIERITKIKKETTTSNKLTMEENTV